MVKPDSGLDAFTPFGLAGKTTIDRLFEQMMKNLPGTRDGEDIEALHDMRVASRRLRAALRVFGKCFPKKDLQKVTEEVQNVTRALGAVRDIDVFLEFLENYRSKSDHDVSWLIDAENALREQARRKMLASLDELEQGSLSRYIRIMCSHAKMLGSGKSNRSYVQAPGLIAPRLTELLGFSSAVESPENVAELHGMRIAAKRLRYTMETFVPCFGEPMAALIDEAKGLQEELGQIHDCDVWVDKLLAYRNSDRADYEKSIADEIIMDRKTYRQTAYDQFLAYWHQLCEQDFAGKITTLSASKPSGEVEKMEEVLSKEGMEQVAAESPVEKPVRRRTTRAAAKPEAAEPSEASESPSPKPTRRARTAKTGGNEETAVKETNVEQVSLEQSLPVEVVEAAVPVETEVSEPQHPVIVELKGLVQSAASNLTAVNALSAKMAKQLGKAETTLELLPEKLRNAAIKDAKKAERWMTDLKRYLRSLASAEKLSSRKEEKLREGVRASRKKLAGISAKKGKK